jgi:hypothetical protein
MWLLSQHDGGFILSQLVHFASTDYVALRYFIADCKASLVISTLVMGLIGKNLRINGNVRIVFYIRSNHP